MIESWLIQKTLLQSSSSRALVLTTSLLSVSFFWLFLIRHKFYLHFYGPALLIPSVYNLSSAARMSTSASDWWGLLSHALAFMLTLELGEELFSVNICLATLLFCLRSTVLSFVQSPKICQCFSSCYSKHIAYYSGLIFPITICCILPNIQNAGS